MDRARLLLLTWVFLVPQVAAQVKPFDVLIENGRVVDGTGNPWYAADIGIRDGVIVEIGTLTGYPAVRVIDARHLTVAPGFIDMMGGSSLPLLRDPASAESKLRQGITTMMVGEGDSLAPQTAATIKDLFEGPDVPLRWQTYGEYFRLLEKKGIGLNVVHNVGAAQVRRVVLGDEDRAPTPGQLARMKDLVEQAMNDGAVGLSTALIYPPGAYARTEEIIELAKVAARRGGIYFSHMRNESKQLLEAIEETIRIGKEAQIPVHIYHLKAAGEENWPLMGKALKRMREAREQGIDITADIYPYDRNGIGLRAFIHPRHYAQGAEAFLATLSRADVRKAIEEEMETTGDWENWFRHVGKNWDNVLIASTGPRGDPTLNGLSIGEAAARRNVRPWDLFFDLVQESDAFVCPRSMDEEQKRLALGAPFVAIDTDAAPINPASVATGLAQSFHPRALGTFPRVLARYVREEKVLPLEEAIRRMSSLAANRLKLLDRGRIAPGMKADVVIFDANRIQDTATFTRPLSYPEGIEYVLVNGKLAIDGAKATGVLAGTVIRNRR